jgi:insecticidal toxin complex protein TccC
MTPGPAAQPFAGKPRSYKIYVAPCKRGLPAKAISLTPTCYFLQYRSDEKRLSLASTIAKDRHAVNVRHDTATPTLSVMDPRLLAIRSVGYCRQPDKPVIESRINRQIFDAAGRLIQSWDPQLWGMAPKPNLATLYGLNGQPLLTDSVDAGWQLSLLDQTGSLRSFWDGRGSQRHTDYDDQQRPITVTEQAAEALPRVVERLTYGSSDPAFAVYNQRGQLIRHDDPVGTQVFSDYGLTGSVLIENRRFLTELEIPDWPAEFDARDAELEEQSFVTRHTFNPTGEILHQTDAMDNVRTFDYDLAGKLSEVWLQVAGDGKQAKLLLSDIHYNAHDQIESETAGNGVVTHAHYSADDGRLISLVAALGNQKPLQDLNYLYDPMGNVIELEDKSQPVTHFNNQRVDPINRFRYDSLYQLVEARGWEVSTPSHGPALPELVPTPLDTNQRRNYTQQFNYDAAGNLITRHHSDAPGFSMFTSASSNRSLAQRDDGSLPGEPEIASGFDACGNQLELQRGQTMVWDVRNQLSRVTLVKREGEPDDYECYAYDRPGHRLLKVGFAQSSGRTLRTEVRYLPGLEIHRSADGEEHHVISVEAGRSNVRTLHWPEGIHDDQLRYSLSDHLGSSALELDDEAGVLTQEHYYPFGGTACWAGKNALVAKYKTIRYSGKERDATGLYYYGYRYYAPWLQRWINPDPSGAVDSLNLFRVLRNSPISLREYSGLMPVRFEVESLEEQNKSSQMECRAHENEIDEINLIPVNETFLGRVDAYFKNNVVRIEQLNKALDHQQLSEAKISSSRMILPESGGEVIRDEFINEYHSSGKWVFRGNYKESKTAEFYASDVQLVQAVMMGMSDYPTMIVRNEVKNKSTLEATERFESDTDGLREAFFGTPNGKNTAQIMKALDMEVLSVKRSTSTGADFPSFYIAVRPKANGRIMKPLL